MRSPDESASCENEVLIQEERENEPCTKRTPLPKFQLFIVLLIQFAEPVTATVIYPFVNQFVRETGVIEGDQRKTGYYAGIIESAFFLAEALTVFQWGWMSDRVGRRPILLLGPLGLSIGMLSFGLAKGYWALVVSRCMQGVFNGNIGVSKTVMAEITDASNIADAYAMMPLMWSVGSTIGPILGGILSRPETNWPNSFGKIIFLREYPYFLSCAVAALLAFVSGAIAFVGLRETLPSAVAKQELNKRNATKIKQDSNFKTSLLSNGTDATYGATSQYRDDSLPAEASIVTPMSGLEVPPPLSSLLTRRTVVPMVTYLFLAFVDMSGQVLRPLVYSTSIPLGGLEFDAYRIGAIMGTWGFINTFIQVFFLAKLIRMFGPRKIQIIAQCNYAIVIALYPVASFFAKQAGFVDAKVWAVVILQLCLQITNNMAYGAINISIVDSAPRAALGATNGIAQALGSMMRCIAPSIASSLFSVSLEKQLAGGNMVYIILVGLAFIGVYTSFMLPKKLHSEKR